MSSTLAKPSQYKRMHSCLWDHLFPPSPIPSHPVHPPTKCSAGVSTLDTLWYRPVLSGLRWSMNGPVVSAISWSYTLAVDMPPREQWIIIDLESLPGRGSTVPYPLETFPCLRSFQVLLLIFFCDWCRQLSCSYELKMSWDCKRFILRSLFLRFTSSWRL